MAFKQIIQLLTVSNYLEGRKQFICFGEKNTELENITCGVPQGSLLRPLRFLIYINDIYKSSDILNFILFADDTNLFFSHKDIKHLFNIVNIELAKIQEWFKANKLSLNTGKTKYTLFHKLSKTDNIPLKLPELALNDIHIKREYTMIFLGVLLDDCLTWRKHIELIENKIWEFCTRLNICSVKKCMINIYFSFTHSYINDANIAWSSTNRSKLSKLFNKQKHASRVILFQDRHIPAKLLMTRLKTLNISQLNIYQILLSMFKIKHNQNPDIFNNQFSDIHHKYSTRFSSYNFLQPKKYSNSTY